MSENLIGATTAVFPIRLSVAVSTTVDVEWSTRDGSAVAGSDYKAAAGTVTFLPGETEKQIEVQVYGQSITPADDKVFFIRLNPPSNAVLVDAILTCTINIIDDQGVPSVAVVVAEGRRGPKGDPGLSAYEQAVLMGYTGTLAEWMDQIADASKAADRAGDHAVSAAEDALKAQNAAKNAVFAGVVFPTAAEGVDPILGVQNGAYFNVRSPLSEHYIDEYQNVNGVAVATGKSYPTSDHFQNISEHTALPFVDGTSYKINRRVILANGDIVKSMVDSNANDPNVDMTGWSNTSNNVRTIETVSDLTAIINPKDGEVVFVKGYYAPTNLALSQPYFGGGLRTYVESRKNTNDGFLCINGWVLILDSINEFTPEHAGADDTDTTDTQSLQKLFALAYVQPISIVFERMYASTQEITCYYVQTHNKAISVSGRFAECGINFKGALSNKVLFDIHGYHARIDNISINEQTDSQNTNIGIRICGEDDHVSNIVMRGYFKKCILGVAALKSKFSNLDIQTANDTDENFVGIGLQLAACVNTDLTGTSFIGRTDCPMFTGLLDGETYESLKPPSYTQSITWDCEGIGIEGIKSVKSNTGLILKGLEIQVSRCISDFNKFKFFTLEGQLIKITDSWFACDNNTPANQEMIGSTGTGCAYATLTNNTFDGGQATEHGQTATFNFPFSTYIANISNYIACTVNAQNEALCLFNKPSISGGTPEWVISGLSDNSVVLPRFGKSKFSNGINIGKNIYQLNNAKLGIRIDSGETGIEISTALGTILSTCEGGLPVQTVTPDNTNVLKVGSMTSSGRSIAATGTINASGADYAEYMLKSETCGIIKAGDICGINADGLLTDKYDDAIDFVIKSTSPSIVGNDNHTADDRQKVDRIAFCGQVPVNVLGGKSGDYLIATRLKDGGISGEYIKSPTFDQYMRSIGKLLTGNTVKVLMH